MKLPRVCPLALDFCPVCLKRDIDNLRGKFYPYPNPLNIGPVFVAPLISPGGDVHGISAAPNGSLPSPTSLLNHTELIKHVLESFPAPIQSARLVKTPPLSGLYPHYDNWRSPEAGVIRLQLPLTECCSLKVDDENQPTQVGRLYYTDVSKKHSVFNRLNQPRYTLLIDSYINEALIKLFPDDYQDEMRRRSSFLPQIDKIPYEPVSYTLTLRKNFPYLQNPLDHSIDAQFIVNSSCARLRLDQKKADYTLQFDGKAFHILGMGPGLAIELNRSDSHCYLFFRQKGELLLDALNQEARMTAIKERVSLHEVPRCRD